MFWKNVLRMLALIVALSVMAGGALAGGDPIKDRMLARLPEVNALKAKGLLGENNKGYLEFVGGQQEKAALVASENADRRQVYAAIAKQQGTSADLVGARRAMQIAESAAPGAWLQNAKGSWQQKQ